jgi:uncharacterized protein (TIGR00369 family)
MSDMGKMWREALAAGMGHTPFLRALEGEIISAEQGLVRMKLPYSEKLVGNPDTGVVHGGVITGLLDQCCGMAVGSALRAPMSFATLDLRIDYMKPAQPHADLFFEAQCLKITHEIAFTRAYAFQETIDAPVAIATGTFMFTRLPAQGS